MFIHHLTRSCLLTVFAVTTLATPSFAAIIATSGTAKVGVRAGFETGPPPGSRYSQFEASNYTINLPGSGIHTEYLSANSVWQKNNGSFYLGGFGSSTIDIKTATTGILASGEIVSAVNNIPADFPYGLYTGEGSGTAKIDLFFTIATSSAQLIIQTSGAYSNVAVPTLTLTRNDVSYAVQNNSGSLNLSINSILTPGNYHLVFNAYNFGVGSNEYPNSAEKHFTYQISVVPEVSNILMLGTAISLMIGVAIYRRIKLYIC